MAGLPGALYHATVFKCIVWGGVRAESGAIFAERVRVSYAPLGPWSASNEKEGIPVLVFGTCIWADHSATADERGAIAEPSHARIAKVRAGKHTRGEDHFVFMPSTCSPLTLRRAVKHKPPTSGIGVKGSTRQSVAEA